MTTINISLPDKLKTEAEALVKKGFYASFSDVVRDSLRKMIATYKYDRLLAEAKEDLKNGKATVLKNKEDIDNYFKKL